MEARIDSPRNDSRRTRRLWIGAGLVAFAALTSMPASAQQERAVDKVADKVHTVNHSFEAYVSGKSLDVQYNRELRVEDVGVVEGSAGVFWNEQRDLVGMFDALMYIGDQARQREIEVSVGTRIFAAFLNQENEDTLGVGFGGKAEWFFNQKHRSSLRLSLFYAPDILTFGIADDVKDYAFDLTTKVGDKTYAFVGFRHLEIATTSQAVSGNRNLDDDVHIGFRHTF
jgi:hypothetical protein